MSRYYVLGDGDNIREKVERLLLSGDLDGLSVFSRTLSASMQTMAEQLESGLSAQIVFVGGDDILFEVDKAFFDENKILILIEEFKEKTGVAISFGIGTTLESAYINLRRAKVYGGGKIVSGSDVLSVTHASI